MGKPKAWLPVRGEYLLQRVVGIASSVVDPVIVAARPRQSLPPLPQGVEIVYDTVDNAGPLGGLASGFAHLTDQCDAVVVVSCDHPLVRPSFIRRLIDLLGAAPGIIPIHGNQQYPLIAVYRVTLRTILVEMLARRQFRVHDFANRCGARVVKGSELAEVDPDLASLRNVNDPKAYSRILQDLEG